MMLKMRNQKKLIDHWRSSSGKEWVTANSLFGLRRYDMCLFFCHLSVEKLLKAMIVKRTGDTPPFIHDLNRLAAKAGLDMSEGRIKELEEITKFNVQARYDDIKLKFYKKATQSFAQNYLRITEALILWLKKEFQKQ